MDKKIDHKYTDEIVCPYCGYKSSESYEYEWDDGELECDGCGKEFSYCREIEVTYTTTKKDCVSNGEEHDFVFDHEYDYVQRYGRNKDNYKWEYTPLPPEEHEHVIVHKCSKCNTTKNKRTPLKKEEDID